MDSDGASVSMRDRNGSGATKMLFPGNPKMGLFHQCEPVFLGRGQLALDNL